MAYTYKVLGQSAPSATTLTALYTVPAATSAVASTISICNRAGSAGTYRVSVAPAGAGDTNSHYLVYDAPIAANESLFLTLGLSLATTDVVRVYASSANMTFNLFGTEIT